MVSHPVVAKNPLASMRSASFCGVDFEYLDNFQVTSCAACVFIRVRSDADEAACVETQVSQTVVTRVEGHITRDFALCVHERLSIGCTPTFGCSVWIVDHGFPFVGDRLHSTHTSRTGFGLESFPTSDLVVLEKISTEHLYLYVFHMCLHENRIGTKVYCTKAVESNHDQCLYTCRRT